MKQDIENIIKKNLPEKKETPTEICREYINNSHFNQALSQINTSLIADEVLKVVVEKIHYLPRVHIGSTKNKVWYIKEEDLLLILSINKENKNNE